MNVPPSIPIEPYLPHVLQRAWGQEIFFAETPLYLGKILKMRAGAKGGLQWHVEKDETFHLLSGSALVRSVNADGALLTVEMQPGQSYRIPPGAVHQVEAITACVLLEASTTHYDDRVRCERFFGLEEGGGLPTTR